MEAQLNTSFMKYILALLLFGTNGIVASMIYMNSYEIVLLRTFIGSLLLVFIFIITKNKFGFYKNKRDTLFLIISGIAMGASWMFLYEAYVQIGVGIASLCYYCGPVIVIMLSPFVFKEKLTALKVVGFATVVAGIILVNGQSEFQMSQWGIFCGLASAVMYAVMLIANKKNNTIVGLENSTLQLVFAFITVAVFVGFKQGLIMDIPSESIIPILVLGLLNTGIGCYLYFSSIDKIPVQSIAVFGYLEPLSAIVFSALLLGETMVPLQILGAVLIIGGAIFTEHAGKKREKSTGIN